MRRFYWTDLWHVATLAPGRGFVVALVIGVALLVAMYLVEPSRGMYLSCFNQDYCGQRDQMIAEYAAANPGWEARY